MTKQELRKIFLQKRSELSEADYLRLNRQLCDRFFTGIDLSFITVLHTFLPIEKNKEPNTWLIIDRIRREFPHVRLTIPKINSQTGELESFFFEGLHQLKPNAWGILEPKQGVPAAPEKIDMVLVPLLAFDSVGNRVGYGKGFYDKFLVTCKPSCQKIGISLFTQSDTIGDIDAHDIPVDKVVTPEAIFMYP